jgi:hypothetical protein
MESDRYFQGKRDLSGALLAFPFARGRMIPGHGRNELVVASSGWIGCTMAGVQCRRGCNVVFEIPRHFQSYRRVFVYRPRSLNLVASSHREQEDDEMECGKCQGLMVAERVTDGLTHLNEWRCLNCGCILDPVIAQHQNQSQQRSQVAAAA